ncbi:hypothetical protein MKW98_007303 [Papaver atlanticum]|uniref:Uncharacterized protein n=1 Tax=Papaver atlanticum TaxID=357466 RepID=A0AAD4SBH0_9MAGN|nr:hypothetical protein MKW98_007303 [Papaver atlanticum]
MMMMTVEISSPVFHLNTSSQGPSKLWSLKFNKKPNYFGVVGVQKKKRQSLKMIRSILDDRMLNIGTADEGSTKPVRFLLETLFAQTQKLEEQISRASNTTEGIDLGLTLETVELDLQAALAVLLKKEEDLKKAESMLLLEDEEVNRAKVELERQEEEIAVARSKQEKIEEDLKWANLNLASQARQIEDLKLTVKEKDRHLSTAKSALSLKEDELDKMRNELSQKSEEVTLMGSELNSRIQLLNEATELIKRQGLEVQELHNIVNAKKLELQESMKMRELERGRLKLAEEHLQKRTLEWLSANEELKYLAENAHRNLAEANETFEDFKRVKKLLVNVKSELVSSQKSLASSRKKMEEQGNQLENQLVELKKQKNFMKSYLKNLENAQVEVESERAGIDLAKNRNKEVKRDLNLDEELITQLQEELNKERSSLELANQEIISIQTKLEQNTSKFEETQNLLRVKESELVEERLQLQHLKSEWTSTQLILQERDTDLFHARQNLEELYLDIAELKRLLTSREEQLIQTRTELQDKDKEVDVIQSELNDTMLKYSEAASVVKRITDLTNKLVHSMKEDEEGYDGSAGFPLEEETELPGMEHLLLKTIEKPVQISRREMKQLETELEMTKESLREKEMEVLATQRALLVKDEKLKTVINRLDDKEGELSRMKEEMVDDANGLRKLYELAQEKIGDKTIGDLAIERLQLEAAQLEVEAATTALQKLANMSGELLDKANITAQANIDEIFPEVLLVQEREERLSEAEYEIARLSNLTEQLVKDAGILDGSAN